MMIRRLSLILLALAVLGGAPTAQQRGRTAKPAPKSPAAAAPAKAATERAVPFRAGESLTFDVSWSSYLTAGTATTTVREKKPSFGSTAYYIVAEARPTPLLSKLYTLYYKADTLLDAYSLLPQRSSVYSEEGKRHRMKITRFNQASRKAEYEVQTATIVKAEIPLPAYVQDILSALYVLRAVPVHAGSRMTMPISDSGQTYRVQMVIGNKEPIKTGIGNVSAFRITPVAQDEKGQPAGRGLAIWLSDDARRLPVRLEADSAVGKFNLSLREATGTIPPA